MSSNLIARSKFLGRRPYDLTVKFISRKEVDRVVEIHRAGLDQTAEEFGLGWLQQGRSRPDTTTREDFPCRAWS